MADIDRLRKMIDNRHDRILNELARQYKDIDKLFAEIEERGKLIDALAVERQELRQHMEWLTDRLVNVYRESENVDYVLKTRRLMGDE